MEEVERIDLIALAAECEVDVKTAPSETFDGAAMVVGGCASIFVNENQLPERFRFTFAHELGHIFLPWHYRELAEGHQMVDTSADLEGSGDEREREANEFAAELLAPASLVRPLLRRGSLDIAKAISVAQRFCLSRTAAAVRMAQVAPEPVAALLFRGDTLAWRYHLRTFPFGIPTSGLRPPAGSATADVMAGQADVTNAVDGDGSGWFVDRRYDGTPAIMESCIRLGARNEVLTLLWAPPE